MDKNKIIRDLANVINCHSVENLSNTPDFILAEHLYSCIEAWNKTTKRRNDYYSTDRVNPGVIDPLQPNSHQRGAGDDYPIVQQSPMPQEDWDKMARDIIKDLQKLEATRQQLEVEKAVRTLTKALRNDPSFFEVYQANMAMAFKLRYNLMLPGHNAIMIHEIANHAAKNFLNSWIEINAKS